MPALGDPAGTRKHPRRGREHVGARIANLVDPMAEAHEPLAALDLAAQHGLGARRVADLEHHVERRARRAAVQRPLERADRAGHGRDEIGARRHDDARGEVDAFRP